MHQIRVIWVNYAAEHIGHAARRATAHWRRPGPFPPEPSHSREDNHGRSYETQTPTPSRKPNRRRCRPMCSKSPNSRCRSWKCRPAFREFAEKGIAHAKENYEKMKSAAEEATDVLEETYARHEGHLRLRSQAYRCRAHQQQRRVRSVRRTMTAKSYSEVVELSTSFYAQAVRDRDRTGQGACREAQKVAQRSAEPLKQPHRRAHQGRLRQAADAIRSPGF